MESEPLFGFGQGMSENRWISDLHWRREGQQTRSERTQTRLIDAAEALILEKGTEATSIADIAARAGSSVGTVYHHFKDKKALFLALFARMTERYKALNAAGADPARWQGATIRDLMRGYLELTMAAYRENAAAKAAVSVVMADFPELARHYAEIQAETRKALYALMHERRAEVGHPDPDAALAFTIDTLAALMRARMDPAQRAASLQDLSDEDFVAQVLSLAATYLRLKP